MELNKLYNENNLDTMGRMPDCFLDLTVTSPPYDNLRDYKGFSFDFENVAKELFRVTKKGGVVVWVVGDSTVKGSETVTSAKQKIFFREICGFNIHDTMIYEKNNPAPKNDNRYTPAFEYMFVFSKGKPKTFNPIIESSLHGGKMNTGTFYKETGELVKKNGYGKPYKEKKVRKNIWTYNLTGSEDCSGLHPAIFPQDLAAEHIYTWSNEGDIVYDPFAGSGTTLKMAHLLQRKWIGSEISKEYCELAEKRLDPYLRQQTLFSYQ